MAEFETVSDVVLLMKGWADGIPRRAVQGHEVDEARARFGNRHGSWILALHWNHGGLDRSAELALTNSEVTPDDVSGRTVLSARASASTDERYVAEVFYEKQRAVVRLSEESLLELLEAAVIRATGYSPAALVEVYEAGIEGSQSSRG